MVEGGGGLRIEPTDATLGALVTGVRLAEVGDEDWERIEAAFLDRGVLIFPSQHLDDEQQMAFGRRWGELNESQALSNRRADGTTRDADDPLMRLYRGNEGWHTTARSRRCRPRYRSCRRGGCPGGADRPNGPTCAPPTRRGTRRPAITLRALRLTTRCTTPRRASANPAKVRRRRSRNCTPWPVRAPTRRPV